MKGLIDTTLREGGQTAGVAFCKDDKIAIFRELSRVGVEEVELGVATEYDKELPDLLRQCRAIPPGTCISLWCMCRKENIRFAASLAPDILSLSIPVSDIHIEKKLKKTRQWVKERVRTAIREAQKCGFAKISLGLEDASRADFGFITQISKIAKEEGAFRLRIADTVGVATPLEVKDVVQVVREVGLETGVHCHNDFGMATANCITALESGADWVDTTVLGLGERAGNAKFEEVAGFLALKKERPYQTALFSDLCNMVARIADVSISKRHPVIGSDIFACETGLHLQGLESDPSTYEPYSPQKVGAKRRLVYGQKIGRGDIRNRLASLSISCAMEHLDGILKRARQKANELGRPLEDWELVALCPDIYQKEMSGFAGC